MVGSRSVFQAVDAAGAFCNVSTNCAGRLARRIGNVIQAELRRRPGHLQVDDARLDHRQTIRLVELEDFAHPRQLDYNAFIKGQGAARQSSAGAARSERHSCFCEHLHYGSCLIGGGRKNNSSRTMLVLRQAIAFIHDQLVRLRENVLAADNRI